MAIEVVDLLTTFTSLTKEEAEKTESRLLDWLQERIEPKLVEYHFKAMTTTNIDQMVVIDNIEVDAICPHHLLPVTLRVHIGYMPNGQVLGLSKFARIAQDIVTAELQEEYTHRLVRILGNGIKPHWAMVIIAGEHECMMHRGVKSRRSETVTSAIYNVDYDDNGVLKKEFMDIVLHNLRK